MINVVIADDHRLVAEGLAQLIGRLPDTAVAGIACTLGDAVSLAGSRRPQILLLDVGMPDGDGIDAIPQLLEACPSCRIIMLTMYAEAAVVHRAMECGASGFVLKSTSSEELAEAISSVAAGGTFLCRESQALIDNDTEAPPMLTPRERDILRLIVGGLSQKQIADRLCLGFETVRSYTKYLRKKLGCANTASMVRKAIEQHLV